MTIEERRFAIQKCLDSKKSQEERNKLGQFSTPYGLACEIMRYAKKIGVNASRFLEPSIGTGVFYSALQSEFRGLIHIATGYEIDKHYYDPACELWQGFPIALRNEDFLKASIDSEKYSLLVANPPYSRHHHLDSNLKKVLKKKVLQETGIQISGLAGLYCYFMLLSTKWIEEGGVSIWLIPSEFMDVNYGEAIKKYLLQNVTLIHIHRFCPEDVQFDDAMVTSSIVVFKNEKPQKNNQILLSEGGTICHPKHSISKLREEMSPKGKWSNLFTEDELTTSNDVVLGDFFKVSRGLATGDNNFFIIDKKTIEEYSIPQEFLVPVLPAPRNMKTDLIEECQKEDHTLFIFSCSWAEDILRDRHPGVWRYLQMGRANKVHEGYICSHRPLWYSCERRKPAPFVMPYMGRDNSESELFRFILNRSTAIATNGYLMLYPKAEYEEALKDKDIQIAVWEILKNVPKESLTHNGRVYGGGLHKLEPKELMTVPMPQLKRVLTHRASNVQLSLF